MRRMVLVLLGLLGACGSEEPMMDAAVAEDASMSSDAGAADAGAIAMDDAGVDAGPALDEPWFTGPAFPQPVDHHVTVIGESPAGSFLYVLGGLRVLPSGQPEEIYASVYRARIGDDGGLGGWEELAPLPRPLSFHALEWISPRRLALIGGLSMADTGLVAVPEVFVADLEDDGTFSEWRHDAQLTVPTMHGTASKVGERVYVVGGGAGLSDLHANVWSFVVQESEGALVIERREEASLPEERSHHTSYVSDGRLFVAGGMHEGQEVTSDVLEAQWEGDRIVGWGDAGTFEASLVTASGPSVNGELFFVGGFAGNRPSTIIGRFEVGADGLVERSSELRLPEGRGHVHQTPVHSLPDGRQVLYSVGGRVVRGGVQRSVGDVYAGVISAE